MTSISKVGTKRIIHTATLGVIAMFGAELSSAGVLEEIVVTAQKREQNLQDVGVAVTAFSGDQFRAFGFTNSTDISAQTPGLNISSHSPSLVTVNIRGVAQNDFADHYEPPVALYVDETYVSAMGAAMVQSYDLERVEILKGPQGTLFGRNATGGLLHYISKKPSEEFNGYAELTVADYDQIKFEGAVGGALTDSTSGRLSVASNKHDGYLDNSLGDDLNDADTWSVRGQLLFSLGESSDLLLKMHYSEDDMLGAGYSHQANGYAPDGFGVPVGFNELGTFFDAFGEAFQTCPGCDAFGYREPENDLRKANNDHEGFLEREISGITAKFTIDLGGTTLTSITDYLELDKEYSENTNGGARPSTYWHSNQNLEQFSQEIRFNGASDSLVWTAGLYYLDIANETDSGLDPIDLGPFLAGVNPEDGQPWAYIPVVSAFDATTDSESWAVFGHLEFELSEQWSLVTALRYTEDEKESDYLLSSEDDFLGPPQHFYSGSSSDAKQDFNNWSGKLGLDWTPNEDTLIYASLNRGHKAGSFNYVFLSFEPLDFSSIPHDEEELTSFEMGYKGEFMDGRARLNIAAFYYDYKNHQASFFVNLANTIGNVDASAYGGELEFSMSPTERLEFMVGVSLLETETEDVGMPDGSIQDRELAYSPDFSANYLVRYTWPLRQGAAVAAQLDGNYTDDFCFTVVCNYTEEEDSYFINNARLTYTSENEDWSLTGFVRNLGDEDYRHYSLDAAFVGFRGQVINPPRWWGVTAAYNW